MKLILSLAITMAATMPISSVAQTSGNSAQQSKSAELARVIAATNQYRDVEVALQAGYISSVDMGAGCSTASGGGHPSQLGAMGIHFVQLAGFGEPDVDFENPNILVYIPKEDMPSCTYSTGEVLSNEACRNNLSLAAVEELVFAHLIPADNGEYWNNVPHFGGQDFYYLHDNPETTWVDEAHGFPPHYALHIWLFENNPAGLYSPWNPNVSCY